MAKGSGTITLSCNYKNWSGRLVWNSTLDYSKNTTSSLSISFQVKFVGAELSQSLTLSSINLGYNGQIYTGSVSNKTINVGTWTTLNTWSFKAFEHDSSGNASIKIGFAGGNGSLTFYLANDITVAMPKIPKPIQMTSAPNFDDNGNPTISFYNEGGRTTNIQVCISLTGAKDDVAYRSPGVSSGSYTFKLTPAERTALINGVTSGTSRTVRFYVKGVMDGSTYWSYLTRTFTLTDCLPELYPTVKDVNPITNNLTGNDNVLVRYASHAKCIANGVAKKGATIKMYEIANGPAAEHTNETVLLGPESATTRFTATDSRGNSEVKEVISPLVEYIKPTCDYKIELDLAPNQNPGDESKMKVSFELTGQWFSGNFGRANNDFSLWIRQAEGTKIPEEMEWYEITILSEVSRGENTYKATFSSDDFDYDKTYTFQFMIKDSIGEFQTAPYVANLYPVFDWSEKDFNFNVPVSIKGDLTIKGSLTVEGEGGGGSATGDSVIETGTAAMGSNGTWYWEKWASGKAVCYGTRNYGNMAVSNAWGNGGYYGPYFSQELPEGLFSEEPAFLDITVRNTDSGYAWIARSGVPTATETGNFVVVRFSSGNVSQVHITFHAIGRWK